VDDVVEPDDGETFTLLGTWASDNVGLVCVCSTTTASVSAAVSWTGSAWSVICTGCDATNGPFYALAICTIDSCTSGATHSWTYRLTADIDDAVTICATDVAYLYSVSYTTTAVDDGDDVFLGNCTEVAAVSPTSQTWQATDFGTFECSFNCSVTGASMTITYN
jgi:hypothetical protein